MANRIIPQLTKKQFLRFYENIEKLGNDCWRWTACLNGAGYGIYGIDAVAYLAHRVSYTLKYGPIEGDKELDHLCRTPDCVNPLHLEAVSHIENMQRGKQATKTHCRNGHSLSRDNLYCWKRKNGTAKRICRICHAATELRRYHKQNV